MSIKENNQKNTKAKITQPKKKTIIIVAIVLIGVGAVGVVAVWSFFKGNSLSKMADDENSQAAGVKEELSEGWRIANGESGGDYQASHESLRRLASEATGDAIKESEAYSQLAILALNDDRLDEALEYALRADELHPTPWTARAVGSVFAEANNTERAEHYFRLAIERMGDPGEDERKAYFIMEVNSFIKGLEGSRS